MSFGENIEQLIGSSTNGLHACHHTWERVRIGEIAALVNGYAFKSSGFNDKEGTPIVRIRDVTKGVPGTYYHGPVDDPKMTFIENGQIAIGMDGDFNCRIWGGGQALLNQRVCSLTANEDFYSQKFLALALPGYLKLINDHTSSITVKHLSSLTVRDIPVPLPPLNEQRRIVEKIETLFARLDKGEEALREVQRQLSTYRQSVLKAAVTGQLTADWRAQNAHRQEHGRDLLERILQTRRETWEGRGKYKEPAALDTTDLSELPEGWIWTSLGALISAGPQNGLYLPQSKYGSGTPILRIDDYQVDWLRPMSELRLVAAEPDDCQKYGLHHGDFVVNRVNSVSHLGKTTLLPSEYEGALFESNMMRFSVGNLISKEYLRLYLTSDLGRKKLIQNCKHAVNQASINQGDVEATPVPLPPYLEQEEIVQRVSEESSREIASLKTCQTELARSAALRQSILKDAFAGRLVPQNPDDESASELLARIQSDCPAKSKRSRRTQAA